MGPFDAVDARALDLDLIPVPDAQVVAGAPATGSAPLGTIAGARLGVWEMTGGAMRDVEINEVFVVIDGAAEVVLREGADEVARIDIGPGSVVRLAAGQTTEWIVPGRLRKIYLAG